MKLGENSMYRRPFALLVLAIAFIVSAAPGCGDDDAAPGTTPDDDVPAFQGVDPSVTCSSDRIGWNFTTGGAVHEGAETLDLPPAAGIQIDEATWGLNCNKPEIEGNQTQLAARDCNGSLKCNYSVGRLNYDPAYGCPKNFDATWRCADSPTKYTAHIDGEAGGKTATIDCPPPMTITSATFGKNCGVKEGTHTSPIKAQCDATRKCSYKIDGLGDPAYGCRKDYDVTYTCSGTREYTKHIAGESGGQTLQLACDAGPRVYVFYAWYGDSECNVLPNPYGTAYNALFKACNDTPGCDYKIENLGDPAPGCKKSWHAVYQCSDDGSVHQIDLPGEAGGQTVHLNCNQNQTVITGEKACVPRSCRGNQTRNARLECIDNPYKSYLFDPKITSVQVLKKNLSYEDDFTLNANRPYRISTKISYSAGAGAHPRITPWFSTRFVSRFSGRKVEGFLCSLPPYAAPKTTDSDTEVILGGDKPAAANILPASCFDSRANPWLDAARRSGTSESAFRNEFVRESEALHLSLDVEGNYIMRKGSTDLPLPNPPGFFYNASTQWIDQIAYYQQRELRDAVLKPPTGADVYGNTVDTMRRWTVAPSKRIQVAANSFTITNGTRTVDVFNTLEAKTAFTVNYEMLGDWPQNPFSPSSASPFQVNLRNRHLRATVKAFPYNDEASAITLGSIPIDDGLPTGSSKTATFDWPTSLRDNIFGKWGGVNSLDVKVCLEADGVDPNAFSTVLTDVTGYSAEVFVGIGCTRQTNGLVFTRDFTKRPIAPERSSATASNGASNTSGDDRTSGTQESGQEKSCTETGQGSTKLQTCSTTSRSSMGATGDLGKTYYSSTSNAQRVETASSVTAAPSTTVEALGYQVVDVDDDDQQMKFDKTGSDFNSKQSYKISLAPNWDLLLEALKIADPVTPEWKKGRYNGRMGLGVGLGAKVPFGGIGLIIITASVGASVSIDFELKFQPDNPYGCINNTGTKCYQALPTPMTQKDAEKACQARGGRLAEMKSSGDRSGIFAVAQANFEHWLGGQLGYTYANATCARNTTDASCKAGASTKYIWIGSNKDFASSPAGSSTVTLDKTATAALDSENGLATRIPEESGVVFNGVTHRLTARAMTDSLPSVCEWDPASSTSYNAFSIGVFLGAGAGVGMSFCTPSDDFGLCIDGSFNFVDVGLTPSVGHSSFTLYDSTQRRIGVRSNTYVDVPWQLSLLTAQVSLTLNWVIGSTSWTIAEYEGFKVAGGSLYHADFPSREDY